MGRAGPGSEIRLIDEDGCELPPDAIGEVVGHSAGMMTGYHGKPEKTREAEWFDATGKRFIRTGDVGRFDADGFLVLMDRRKDMIISGGFNVYPSDLEAVLREHPDVADVAVVGVPSEALGRDADRVRRAARGRGGERSRAHGVDQRAGRQDAARGPGERRRRASPQCHRQDPQEGPARRPRGERARAALRGYSAGCVFCSSWRNSRAESAGRSSVGRCPQSDRISKVASGIRSAKA